MRPIDQAIRARLIRLKVSLLETRAASGDPTNDGRHRGIVGFDGVCEQAMFLALDGLGEALTGRRGFAEAHAALKRLRPGLPGLHAVLVQHRIRNLAQHEGLIVDPEQMRASSLDTELFVRAAAREAFGLELLEFTRSEAVADDDVRDLLASAERALDEGDYLSCFTDSVQAFESAHTKWTTLRIDIVRWGRSIRPSFEVDRLIRELGQLDSSLSEIRAFTEVATFASDMGEYHWLLSARRAHLSGGAPVAHEDAVRAMVFAFDWVLRWEAFTVRYPGDRWRDHDRLPAPRSAEGGPPRITQCLSIDDHPGDLAVCRFQLVDLPEPAEPWRRALCSLLKNSPDIAGQYPPRILAGGALEVAMKVGADQEGLLRAVEQGVRGAAGEAARTQAAEDEMKRRDEEFLSRFRAALTDPTGPLAGAFVDVALDWYGGKEKGLRIFVSPEADFEVFSLVEGGGKDAETPMLTDGRTVKVGFDGGVSPGQLVAKFVPRLARARREAALTSASDAEHARVHQERMREINALIVQRGTAPYGSAA